MTEPTTNQYQQVEPGTMPAQMPVVYASFWKRLAALILDLIILGGINLTVKQFVATPDIETITRVTESEGFGAAIQMSYFNSANMITGVVNWLYFALLTSGPWQASLGKRVLGIKVTDMHGERISFLNATGRYFATIISAIILCIGYLMMTWDDKKQTLHDRLAGTLVVEDKA